MAEIIVAIICNLVAALVLVSGVLTSLKCGWKVSLTKFVLVACGAVGTFFLTPVLSSKLLGLTFEEITLQQVLVNYHITQPTVSSLIFLLLFLVFYVITLFVCKVLKHCLIKAQREKATINKAKIKRAKSINPKAERAAKRTAWRELKASYQAQNTFGKKLLSLLLHIVVSVALGIVLLIPFGYVAKDMNFDGSKEFLVKGYSYTLPGVIGEDFSNWAIHAELDEVEEEVEEEQSQEPSVEIPGEEVTPDVPVEGGEQGEAQE